MVCVDIAICMHCYLNGANPMELKGRSEMAESMLYHLLVGYTKVSRMDAQSLLELQSFFRMRDYIYLSTILQKDGELNRWDQQFVDCAMERLINTDIFLDFNLRRSSQMLT